MSQSSSPVSKRFCLLIPVLFAVFFGIYFYFMTQGMPYEIDDVLPSYSMLKDVSYGELLSRLFAPSSYSTYSGAALDFIFVRVTECFFYKDILQDYLPRILIYNLTLTILLTVFIYLFSQWLMQSRLAAALTTLFLMTTAAFAWSIYEFGDSTPMDLLLLIIYLWLLASELKNIQENPAYQLNGKRILKLIAIWAVGMLSLRTKNTNLVVVPPMAALTALFSPGANLFTVKEKHRRIALVLILLSGIYCALPLFITEHNPPGTLVKQFFDIKYLYYILVQNPFGWEAESLPVLFRVHRQLPTSVLSQFGIVLSWLMIAAAPVLFFRRKKSDEKKFSPAFFLLVWMASASVIYVMGGWYTFTRHMIYLLLPAGIAAFYMLTQFACLYSGQTRKIILIVIAGLTLFQSADNLRHSLYLRNEHMKIWGAKWAFREAIFKDREGRAPGRLFELHNYWTPWPQDMWDNSKFFDARSGIPDFSPGSEFSQLVDRYGKAYLAAHTDPGTMPWNKTLILQVDPSEFSILSRLMKRPGKPSETYFLYRIQK